MRKPYIMTLKTLSRYARNGHYPICANPACGCAIKVGDWVQPVYNKAPRSPRKIKLYHVDCYEGIFI